MATEDESCSPAAAEQWFADFSGATEKHMLYEKGWGHNEFGFVGTTAFVDRMVETIETGTVAAAASTLEPVTGSFFSSEDHGGGSSTGAVLGSVVGVCSALAALGIYVLLCKCCRRGKTTTGVH